MDAQTSKKNHTSSSSSCSCSWSWSWSSSPIQDLSDELLIEIFIRLSSYETVISCKFVSKHWLLLLSNPKFIVDFINHKKRTQTNQQLPWAFLSTMNMHVEDKNKKGTKLHYSNNRLFPTHKVFESPKFTLKFLPFPFKVVATFKDLILCINTRYSDQQYYCICNPVTKQWAGLPACPTSPPDHERTWAALVCEDVYYNDKHHRCELRFRVVLVHFNPTWFPSVYHPFKLFNMIVFCSETFEWKSVNLSISVRPGIAERGSLLWSPFIGLVCDGMVCIRHNPYFGMFNPFDVTPTTSNGDTLEARIISYNGKGPIFECGGKLIKIWRFDSLISYRDHKDVIQVSMRNSEFDVEKYNKAPHEAWCMYFIGRCFDNGTLPLSTIARGIIGMHPSNKKVFYMLTGKDEVVLGDMGQNSLKVLGTLHPDHSESSAKLELQYWPTPLSFLK